jgi:hypothetical protein
LDLDCQRDVKKVLLKIWPKGATSGWRQTRRNPNFRDSVDISTTPRGYQGDREAQIPGIPERVQRVLSVSLRTRIGT